MEWADDGLEQAEAVPEHPIHVGLDGAFVVKVDDADNGVLLAETVNAADPLLHPHRVDETETRAAA